MSEWTIILLFKLIQLSKIRNTKYSKAVCHDCVNHGDISLQSWGMFPLCLIKFKLLWIFISLKVRICDRQCPCRVCCPFVLRRVSPFADHLLISSQVRIASMWIWSWRSWWTSAQEESPPLRPRRPRHPRPPPPLPPLLARQKARRYTHTLGILIFLSCFFLHLSLSLSLYFMHTSPSSLNTIKGSVDQSGLIDPVFQSGDLVSAPVSQTSSCKTLVYPSVSVWGCLKPWHTFTKTVMPNTTRSDLPPLTVTFSGGWCVCGKVGKGDCCCRMCPRVVMWILSEQVVSQS